MIKGKQKGVVIFVILGLFLISFVSAGVTLEKEPLSLYNLKDKIEITAKITPVGTLSDLVIFYLSCDYGETEVYKEFLFSETEITKDIVIPLVKEFIGDSIGTCTIKYKIGEDKEVLSDEFKISNLININFDLNGEQYEPGNIIMMNGTAFRENEKAVDGTVEIRVEGEKEIFVSGEVIEGNFLVKVPFPDNFKAGTHNVKIKVYEQNKYAELTNVGEKNSFIVIKQIPTNLEIVLDEYEILPGDTLKGSIVLRDQTGEKINSNAYVAIKNEKEEMLQKLEVKTEEQFEYPIKYNEAPGKWVVSVYSEELINRMDFNILEKEEISIDIVNKTLILENKGNVYYNHTVPIVIGDETINVSVSLPVGETEKYLISAPKGEYNIQAGDFQGLVSLTGNVVKLEKISEKNLSYIKIIAWAFMALILGFVSYTFFRKGYKKTFFGRKRGKKAKKPLELKEIPEKEKLSNPKVKAELSLSITGTKQNSPIGCIFIKNYEEVSSGIGGVKETLNSIISLIENKKGVVYENRGNLFFLLPPVRTKTFKNEMPILDLTKSIEKVLKEHNKKFKQKIDYGLSLNFGTIVTKEDKTGFKFMSMGTLMTETKKIANKSNEEILLGEKFKLRLTPEVKVENVGLEGLNAFRITGISEKKDNSAFINNFLKKNYGK
ncbi:hypothetical protein GW932_00250 [archaeon]|nr:hypothetical protein [archaeon]